MFGRVFTFWCLWKKRFFFPFRPCGFQVGYSTFVSVIFTALVMGTGSAQQAISYTTGENNISPVVITVATNPTPLTISSGTATQSGAINDSGTLGGIDGITAKIAAVSPLLVMAVFYFVAAWREERKFLRGPVADRPGHTRRP